MNPFVNKEYDDLEGVSVVPGGGNEAWKDDHIRSIKRYQVVQMTIPDAAMYGRYALECLCTGEGVDSDLVSTLLHLAVSLRNPDDISKHILRVPPSEKSATLPYALPGISVASDKMTKDEEETLRNIAALGKGEVETKVDKENGKSKGSEGDGSDDEDSMGSAEMQAAAYAFLAAYLMRLQCRSVANTLGGLKRAADRFSSWYDDRVGILSDLDITSDALEKLKEAISRKPEVTSTWVLYLAFTENEGALLKQHMGLLVYVGLQVFAYQGMHALTQVLAIHQESKIALKDLLRELDSPMTRDGVREIARVLREYELTTVSANRKTYFRYARVWDSKYFAQLQSKVCVPLLYVAAHIVKDISQNSTADPTQIYAIQNIGSTMRSTLNRVKTKLVAYILERTMADETSGHAWDLEAEGDKATP